MYIRDRGCVRLRGYDRRRTRSRLSDSPRLRIGLGALTETVWLISYNTRRLCSTLPQLCDDSSDHRPYISFSRLMLNARRLVTFLP